MNTYYTYKSTKKNTSNATVAKNILAILAQLHIPRYTMYISIILFGYWTEKKSVVESALRIINLSF